MPNVLNASTTLSATRALVSMGVATAWATRYTPMFLAALVLSLLAACATGPATGTFGNTQRDGPQANPPPNLESVPDAIPQLEPLRIGGPNKPYEVKGRTYVPFTDDRPLNERGLASWYGQLFHGRPTSSGEVYDMYAMTAAHKTMPIPSYARIRNPKNGREIVVRINDRGPFVTNRAIDLSYTAALKLGVLAGVTEVEIERITGQEIRTNLALQRSADLRISSVTTNSTRTSTEPLNTNLGDITVTAASPVEAAPIVASSPPTSDLGVLRSGPPAQLEPLAATALPAAKPALPNEVTTRSGFWVQLGAYRQREGAVAFQRHLTDSQSWLAPLLAVFTDQGLTRLQAGPYKSRDEAQEAAQRIRWALQLVTIIVEKP